jgi:hypothetical protein
MTFQPLYLTKNHIKFVEGCMYCAAGAFTAALAGYQGRTLSAVCHQPCFAHTSTTFINFYITGIYGIA